MQETLSDLQAQLLQAQLINPVTELDRRNNHAIELVKTTDGRRGNSGRRRHVGAGPANLTTRELEVSILVAGGLTNVAISTRLGVAEVTVKRHVQSIMEKLGVSSRPVMIIGLIAVGVITVDDIVKTYDSARHSRS